VEFREIERVPSGAPARLLLKAGRHPNTPLAAVALARRHFSLRSAHRTLTTLLEEGSAIVEVPCVEDLQKLIGELAGFDIEATLYDSPKVDVRAVRERLGLSQDEFALQFGLDVATVRNWEQGRSEPDRAARTALWTIATNPQAVRDALSRREDAQAQWAVAG
jgi:DNA-binding XRE family transcriptional regulator